MTKVATDRFNDYYEARISCDVICLRYFFELEDYEGLVKYYGNYFFYDVELNNNDIIIRNCGNTVASGVTLECKNEDNVMFSDGCLLILPGEETIIKAEFMNGTKTPLMISGFGVPYHEIDI